MCLLEAAAEGRRRFLESFKKLRIVLGPMEIVGARGIDESAFVNVGDVPISAKYFLEWMTSKYLTENKFVYSLSKFISDLINNLVNRFLNGTKCPISTASQKVRLNQTTITGQAPEIAPNDVYLPHFTPGTEPDVFSYNAVSTGACRYQLSRHTTAQPILNPSGYSGASPRTTIPSGKS